MVQMANLYIDRELEERFIIYFRRQSESGLSDLIVSKMHEMTLSSIPLPGAGVLQTCLNIKIWSDEINESETPILKFDSCREFLIHIACSLILIIAIFICEYLHYVHQHRLLKER